MEELQSLAKSSKNNNYVGEYALKQILDFLKQQGSTEEYQEALDLIYRLIKLRDEDYAKKNASIILEEYSNIELFLDLLDHEDLTVGVMTSQIMTELHANDGATLEALIQKCPDG